MEEKKLQRIRFLYSVVFTALTAIVGGLFILQAWRIFLSGNTSPYTAESIRKAFKEIVIPVCVWLAVLLFGAVMNALFPETEKMQKTYADLGKTLTRLKSRLSQNEGGMYALNKETRLRKGIFILGFILCVISGVAVLFLLFTKHYEPRFSSAFFTEHGGVADRLVRCLPWILSAFVAVCIASAFVERSLKREIALAKTQIAENAKAGIKPASGYKKEKTVGKNFKIALQIGLFVIGISLFVIGIANGGMVDVYEKARNICTQCIGLG